MAFELDPDIKSVVEAVAALGEGPPLARGDWKAIRETFEALHARTAAQPLAPGVSSTDFEATTTDGTPVPLRWFTKDGARPGSAALYLHGGGLILGSVELSRHLIADYVAATGVPMLAVDYRLAPEHPYPAQLDDGFAALTWLVEHAGELGVDPARLAVMGDSAGGGIAAAVALLARDRAVPLARQILLYPMLDDRTIAPDPLLVPFAAWTYDMNYTGWSALLGDAFGTDQVPATAAPARATDLAGLAPAYIEVGELDIFRDETIDYARRLTTAGTSAELHVRQGCPHGFDRTVPTANVVVRAMSDRHHTLNRL